MAAWNIGSRLWLFICNGSSLVLSIVLLVYGAVALQRMGSQASVLTSPFSLVIGMSSLIMIASLCGLGGACCAVNNDDGTPGKLRRHANRALFLYYFVIIFTNCGLFYGMILCFIWSDEANDIVMAMRDTLSEADLPTMIATMVHNSTAAGVICMLLLVLNLMCAHCAACLMGFKYTSRKSVMIINVVGFAMGLTLAILGFSPGPSEVGVKNSWLPGAVGAIGIVLLFFALLGFYAAARLNQVLLLINAMCVAFFSILLFGFGIFCLVDAKDAKVLIDGEWQTVQARFVSICPECEGKGVKGFDQCCQDIAGAHVFLNLSILGISCIVTLALLLCNLAGSYYLWRQLRQNISEEVECGTVSGLQDDGVHEGPAMDRARQYRMNDPSDDL